MLLSFRFFLFFFKFYSSSKLLLPVQNFFFYFFKVSSSSSSKFLLFLLLLLLQTLFVFKVSSSPCLTFLLLLQSFFLFLFRVSSSPFLVLLLLLQTVFFFSVTFFLWQLTSVRSYQCVVLAPQNGSPFVLCKLHQDKLLSLSCMALALMFAVFVETFQANCSELGTRRARKLREMFVLFQALQTPSK